MPRLRWLNSAKRILNHKRKRVPKVVFTPSSPGNKKKLSKTKLPKTTKLLSGKKSLSALNKKNDSNVQRVNDIKRLKDLATTANHIRIQKLYDELQVDPGEANNQINNVERISKSPTNSKEIPGEENSPNSPSTCPSSSVTKQHDNHKEDDSSSNGSFQGDRSPSPGRRLQESPRSNSRSSNGSFQGDRSPSPGRRLQESPRSNSRSSNGSFQGDRTPSPGRRRQETPRRNNIPRPLILNPERDGFFDINDHEMRLPEARENENQLLGQHFPGDTMIHLKNNIFCQENVLRNIRSSCRSGTGVARRLMHGIFNPEHVLNCTLTGRRILNQGIVKKNQPMNSLHNVAREVIKSFAISFAYKRGFKRQSSNDYNEAMTDELGKLKKKYRREQLGQE